MAFPIQIPKTLTRVCEIYGKYAKKQIPTEVKLAGAKKPDLSNIDIPLPSKRSDYTCSLEKDGVLWLGAKTGLTRYEPNAARECDKVMYFSADRDLPDNHVKSLCDYDGAVWALTETGASRITMIELTAEELADQLRAETKKYVDRRGMVTQRHLTVPRVKESMVPYNHSDNDGCFTASYAMGEMCRYSVLKEKFGEDDPKVIEARQSATRAVEAALLLMNISGRGNGFVARTYITSKEPCPDDGLFYRKQGKKTVTAHTSDAIHKNMVGFEFDSPCPVPDRLAKLYRDEGFTDDDITYKGDTSSDEITTHFVNIYMAHEILGPGDPELDELLIMSGTNTLNHIIDNGFCLRECHGKPTTWAKWNIEYFNTSFGWADACLNSAQILMYLRVMMHVTGQYEGKWNDTYNHLIELGYDKLPLKHEERFHMSAMMSMADSVEEMMFGDHMLATLALWPLILLETDEERKENFRKAFKSWNGTIRREHDPGYDIPFLAACPDAQIDSEMVIDWFRRTNNSRLCSGCDIDARKDIARRYRFGGYKETSALLPPDERFISKYDRNPYEWKTEEGGMTQIESCYVYTFAYWLGRYYGLIEE
ncbi:MAG: hypothetical protein IJC45_08660 [Clostridia bacterium]|nr:hypothetical protein [Clostridia bacterium]